MSREDREGLTLFSVPKPFRGLAEIIQRNAIRSWLKLHPSVDVLLLGDDEGVAEVAAELGTQHAPNVARNELGIPLFDSVVEIAQSLAGHSLMAYVNTDIILMKDFVRGVLSIPWTTFVMVGRRWNLTVMQSLDFEAVDWEEKLRSAAIRGGHHSGYGSSDYFVFPRGILGKIPAFAVGRTAIDNWVFYRARSLGVPLIDASLAITVVHQNHDYSHYLELNSTNAIERQGGKKQADSWAIAGMKEWLQQYQSPVVQRNQQLAGEKQFDLLAATWLLTPRGLRRAISRKHLRYHLGTLPILYPRLRPIFQLARRLLKRGGRET